jgi:hypothetical protein
MTGERKIKLVIDVKDDEVKQASASMSRLEKATKDVGKSGNDLKNVESGIGGITSSIGGLAAGFNPITAIITAATVAITAFSVAVIAATKYAYDFAKSFAEYGSEIGKAQKITNLTTETLSALNIEVGNTGGNFESIIDSVKDYATKIADAAQGSKEAQKDLSRLGIDGKKYINDFEGALNAAFQAINKLPPGIAQMSAATKLFGEEGSRELLPIIAKADGDISNLIKTAKEFGLVLSQEDVQASREFNKAMKEVQMELRGVGLTLGRELLPVARDVFREFSGFYKDNKEEIKQWGVYVADVFRAVFSEIKTIINYVKVNWETISQGWQIMSGIANFAASGGKGGLVVLPTSGNSLGESKRPSADNSIQFQSWDSSKVKSSDSYFKPDAGKEKKFQLSSEGQAFVNAGKTLGVSPLDLAVLTGFESGGTWDTWKKGPTTKWGVHRGIFQAGEPQQREYGVFKGQSLSDQIETSLVKYIRDVFNRSGFTTQGASQMQLYSAILAGGVGEKFYDRTDKNGTSPRNAMKNPNMIAMRQKAVNKFFGGSIANIPEKEGSRDYESQMKNIIDLDNQAFAREKFEKLAAFYKSTSAITPSAEFIKSYTDFLNKDIPLDRNKLSTFDIKKQFEKTSSDVTTQGQTVSEVTESRLTLGGEYLKQLNESLETEKKIEQVVALREKHQDIINSLVKDALADQDLLLENLGNQYETQQRLFGDETFRKYEQDIANLEEKLSLEREIFDLENDIANSGLNDSLKIKAAYLQDIISLREREVDAVMQINRAELELSQKGNFSQNQANAAILDHLNSVKSVTEIYADARINIIDNFWNGIDSAVGSVTKKLGFFGGIIKQLIVDFIKLATLKPLQNIFAPGASGGTSQSSGGGFSVGNLLQGFLGGNGSQSSGGFSSPGFAGGSLNIPGNFSFAGAGGTGGLNLGGANFSGSISRFFGGGSTGTIGANGGFNVSGSSLGGRNEFAGTIANQATSQLSNYSKLKGLFSAKGIGALAPGLGLSLGALAGGQSPTGQILGSIGGLAGGLLGGIGTGALSASTLFGGVFASGGALSIGGLSAAMSATVVLAPIAGALLIGSLLLKRNAARRRDEKTRDALMVDTLSELNKIKAEMEAAKPGTNIQGLLDQTGEISGEYFKQANALKDKKTRGIAMKDGNERVGVVPPSSDPRFQNALTNQIYALSEAAKAKQQVREFAAERDRRLLPEFAMGGHIPAKNGGHLAVVGEGGFDEFILSTDPKYANRTASLLANFIERMNYKVPRFETGGISSSINLSQSNFTASSSNPVINFSPNLSLYLNQKEDGTFEGFLESDDGKRKIIKIYKDARKLRDI